MHVSVIQLLSMGFIALASATIALAGNYYINHRLARRRLAADELKRSLFEYLKLVAEYWISTKQRENSHRVSIEARIIAMGSVIELRSLEVKSQSKKLNDWYVNSKNYRMDLLDLATGGCFQQHNWNPEPKRFQNATKVVTRIVIDLHAAC